MGLQLNVTGISGPAGKSRLPALQGGTLVPNYTGLMHPHGMRSE
ncbi:hypothetical protein M2284_000551 [Rhodococcus sp. LBL1]|nr:hypothetical protein [Rhodococcus sp. LBL1]MDH6681649.1 hypothetical protein [Rhodococcus sp. LBL2]